jgi:heterodisulfide reductase subunit B
VNRENRKTINKSGTAICRICKNNDFLHTHHIQGRNILNSEHFSNLVDICPSCHNKVHMGEIIVERWVMTSDGIDLMWHKKGEDSFTGENASPHLIP